MFNIIRLKKRTCIKFIPVLTVVVLTVGFGDVVCFGEVAGLVVGPGGFVVCFGVVLGVSGVEPVPSAFTKQVPTRGTVPRSS